MKTIVTARNNKGFTLIELLVVISIIGMLSSVILVSINSVRKSARDSLRIQHMTQLRNALMLYAGGDTTKLPTQGYYSWCNTSSDCPDSNPGHWWGTGPNAGAIAWPALQTLLSPYLPVLPIDPSGGNPNKFSSGYAYAYLPNFDSGYISNVGATAGAAAGDCFQKTILFVQKSEGTIRRDCTFAGETIDHVTLLSQYPTYMTIVVGTK